MTQLIILLGLTVFLLHVYVLCCISSKMPVYVSDDGTVIGSHLTNKSLCQISVLITHH